MKRYILKNRKLSFLLILSNILGGFSGILLAIVFQYIGDVAGNQRFDAIGYCILLIIFNIIYVYFDTYFYQKTLSAYREDSAKQIKNDLYRGIFRKNVVEFNQENSAQYTSIFNNDVRIVEEQYLLSFFFCFGSIFELVMSIGYALFINVWIGFIMLAMGFMSIFLPKMLTRNLAEVNAEALTQQGHYNSFLKDCFSGFEVIKTTLSSTRFFNQHAIRNRKMEEKRRIMNYKNAQVNNTTMLIMVSCQLILTLTFGLFVLYGVIDLAIMLALIQLENSVFYPLASAVNSANNIKASKNICQKVADLIDTKEVGLSKSLLEFNHQLAINNLCFKYPSSELENMNVLNGFNYTFEKNKKYAIVGSSGCGKSTLVKLLLKQYHDYQGLITLDGVDYQTLDEANIYKIMAVIPQNIFIFNETLRNNITLYQEATDEEIMECANKAGLTPVIQSLKAGLDTLIDENGNNFSGGEKQRIAIARAYLNKNEFVLLDEATGSLDNQTAYFVEKTILDDPTLTCISITHRYNEENLKHYDEILVMDKGVIHEKGRFDELMKNQDLFYELYTINKKETQE